MHHIREKYRMLKIKIAQTKPCAMPSSYDQKYDISRCDNKLVIRVCAAMILERIKYTERVEERRERMKECRKEKKKG